MKLNAAEKAKTVLRMNINTKVRRFFVSVLCLQNNQTRVDTVLITMLVRLRRETVFIWNDHKRSSPVPAWARIAAFTTRSNVMTMMAAMSSTATISMMLSTLIIRARGCRSAWTFPDEGSWYGVCVWIFFSPSPGAPTKFGSHFWTIPPSLRSNPSSCRTISSESEHQTSSAISLFLSFQVHRVYVWTFIFWRGPTPPSPHFFACEEGRA